MVAPCPCCCLRCCSLLALLPILWTSPCGALAGRKRALGAQRREEVSALSVGRRSGEGV